MKIRDIIFMIVLAPVMYAFYSHISQIANTELTIMLTAWLVLVIPTIWFACEHCKYRRPSR